MAEKGIRKEETPSYRGYFFMNNITLKDLLEAGCHFGHKAEKWHPKASQFIYTKKDGIHIIDLAKTKAGLDAAAQFIRDLVGSGNEIVFVGTKRQASAIVKEQCGTAQAPYFAERWIGGFFTNWDEIKKNLDKANRMINEQATGVWKKFPKHEQVKMGHDLERLKIYYGGVLNLKKPPQALFVIDVRHEIAAIREAIVLGIPVIAIIDTNSNPDKINFQIPANDDAVGSISLIVKVLAESYAEGRKIFADKSDKIQKDLVAQKAKSEQPKAVEKENVTKSDKKAAEAKPVEVKSKNSEKKPVAEKTGDEKNDNALKDSETKPEAAPKHRGRPKKTK
jgi:small subunit ribosomal protein S2